MKLGSLNVSFSHVANEATVCTVANRDGLSTGMAKRSKKDHFDKKVGRKIALTKAMRGMTLSKAQKKRVWEDYRTMTKVPRW